MDSLKTGDVILYSRPTSSWLSSFTGMLTRNNANRNKTEYLHCGMILRDPVFVHSSLKGLYVWQTKWTHTLEKNESDSSDSEHDSDTNDNESTANEPTTVSTPITSDSDKTNGLNADSLSVEIVPLKQILDECECPNITVRVLSCGDEYLTTKEMRALHATVTDDPKNIFPQEEIKGVLGYCDLSSYDWSATFLGYLYTKCNLLSKETQWHLLRSQDFASDTQNVRFCEGVSLDNDENDLI
jgi:hypothetical protein